jgi:hypothetical protein
MNQPPLPSWVKYGSGAGLILVGVTALVPLLLQHAQGKTARGTVDDPLPPADPPPPSVRFVSPLATPIDPVVLRTTVLRRWKLPPALPAAGVAVLLAQAELATGRFTHCWNFNAVGMRADRFWHGAWTVTPEPEWRDSRPVFRWAPIRAYASLDAGVHDWLTALPKAVKEQAAAGNIAGFAEALIAAGWAAGPESVYIPEVEAAARRIVAEGVGRSGAEGQGARR